MSINTACASSITAIQQAVSFLNNDGGQLALAGAVNLCLSPDRFRAFEQGGSLSKSGNCKVFDQSADGYVRGEGGAVLVLKPLQRAIDDEDTIYAVIKGVGSSHGGHTNSLTAPSSNALADLIENVYTRSDVDPSTISYIETHAVGAPLGDPMEIFALKTAFQRMSTKQDYQPVEATCGLGSAKANLGHLEAAAGMAGILKVIAAMQHQTLPASIHFSTLNSTIRLKGSPFYIVAATKSWDVPSTSIHQKLPRRAGVSAIGFGGVNAHVILQEYQRVIPITKKDTQEDTYLAQESWHVIPLSAKNAASLQAYALSLRAFLRSSLSEQEPEPSLDIRSLAYTLQIAREAMAERVVFSVRNVKELLEKLDAYVDGVKDIGNCWKSHVVGSSTVTRLLTDDEDAQALIRQWIINGKIEKIAEGWIEGLSIDWALFYAHEATPLRRLGLPTYQFARHHYWLTEQKAIILAQNHPVVPVETPQMNDTSATPLKLPVVDGHSERLEELVSSIIIVYIAQALKMPAGDISREDVFVQYGLTSLIGVQLLDMLNERLGCTLEATALFEHSSVQALTRYVVSHYKDILSKLLVPGTPAQREQVTIAIPASVVPETHAENTEASSPLRSPEREPIAIIGMSGRFAKSRTVDELWEHLVKGDDLVENISRWSPSEVYPDIDSSTEPSCLQGSFLDDIDQFDPLFFKISGLEATYMDPQQRLFLEECWKALEDAGYAGESVNGHACGVYVGVQKGDYDRLFETQPPSMAWWGNADSVIPARIAYYLNLKGPAIAIDSACSSSLVAIHLACQGLWNEETNLALAGGVFVQSTPWFYQTTDRAEMLSPGGHCFTFDVRANGFVPGEGVGVVALKRLSEAVRDGDHIYGVVKGSGINQDGATNGIAAPSVTAQTDLEQSVYDTFHIDVEQIQMVEAHGTGTALGDPIEIDALRRAFSKYTDKKGYCSLGSIKANIGHTAAAAGMASVFKVLLALKHETLPPMAHFHTVNPKIELDDSPFYIHTTSREWKTENTIRRQAAISSFSFCGTNAHLVIEEAPHITRPLAIQIGYLIVLSARSQGQVRQQATQLLAHLEQHPDLSLAAVSFTLWSGRKHCEQRLACVVQTLAELMDLLRQWLAGNVASQLMVTSADQTAVSSEAVQEARLCIQRCQEINASLSEGSWAAYQTDLLTLARLYVHGARLDLNPLFDGATRTRVSLPTYPFMRQRYWITPAVKAILPPPTLFTANEGSSSDFRSRLGVITSSPDIHHFTLTLSKQDFFVRDHLVLTRPTVPGVVSFEIIRAAMAQLLDTPGGEIATFCLENIVWVQPLIVEEDTVRVDIVLREHEQGRLTYEIQSPTQSKTEEHRIYCQGTVRKQELSPVPSLDLAALRQACLHSMAPEDCYVSLRRAGIEHGPTLQGLVAIWQGPDYVLAKLHVPAQTLGVETCILHPTLLDAAIQAAVGLQGSSTGNQHTVDAPALPFALERLELYQPCMPEMWAVVRTRAMVEGRGSVEKIDIDLCDDTGTIRVRLHGYTSRRLSTSKVTKPAHMEIKPLLPVSREQPVETSWLLQPVWERFAPALTRLDASVEMRVLLCGGTSSQQAAMYEQFPTLRMLPASCWRASIDELVTQLSALTLSQGPFTHLIWIAPASAGTSLQESESFVVGRESGVLPLFRLLKALLLLDYDRQRLQCTVLTTQSLPLHAQEVCFPVHASIHGLVGSLSKEYQRWQMRLLDLSEQEDWPLADIFALPTSTVGQTWIYRHGGWHQQRLLPYRTTDSAPSCYRSGGVYVVIGGAGGIGEVWSEEIIRRYQAQVIWLGRRACDADITAKMERLSQIGPVPYYLQVDASDAEALARVRQTILLLYGRIDGLVNSAVVLQDQSLARMDEARFRRVMDSKVEISVRMSQVFAHDPLDFVLFFSSIESYTRVAGQSNYAAGSTFEDAFVHWLAQQWSCAVKVMNWGYWGDVGMVSTPYYQQRMRRSGLGSIKPVEGMAALEVLLKSPANQLTFLALTRPDALPELALDREIVITPHMMTPGAESVAQTSIQMKDLAMKDFKSTTIFYLKAIISETLLIDAGELRTDERLENYGLDSLAIITVTNRLEEIFGSLSKTIFFEYVNIQELATYFLDNHREKLEAILHPQALSALEPTIPTKQDMDSSSPATIDEQFEAPVHIPAHIQSSQAQHQLSSHRHDIAVIGIAGRFPHAENLEELWQILVNGENCFEPVPENRWKHKEQYYNERDVLGKTVVKNGAFIKDIDKFDARYFNISQHDAELMSPETRQFLQVSVEALEDAGYSKQYLQQKCASNVGVLFGSMNNDYRLYGFENTLTRGALVNGDDQGMIPNRLSYYYGFTGPSIFLDTMCSSSAVCVHQAVQMLRAGDCSMVVVGGANLFVHPYNLISVSQAHFTTKTSENVKSYGVGVDGTILGEGVITVVLKPLADAERDGDHIYTVIKGTGIANAGIRNGFTVPDPAAQAASIDKAIKDAAIHPRSISYLEGHGSGTILGDPIEIRGLTKAYQKYTTDVQFCPIGSVKSNIAHTNAASGLSGLTKVILQLKHRKLVPSLHSEELNPNIDFGHTPFYVQRTLADWKRPTLLEDGQEHIYPRRAGITSIGAVGMSSHIIVEEYPDKRPQLSTRMDARYLMVFSAVNEKTLKANLERFNAYMQTRSESDLASVSYTLQTGKNELPCRLALIVHDRDEMIATLDRLVASNQPLADSKSTWNIRYIPNVIAREYNFEDDEILQYLQMQKIENIADVWVKGAKINWDLLWSDEQPQRLSLPAYCFEQIRCWYKQYPDAPSVLHPSGAYNKLHPFVGKNVSNLYSVKYSLDVYLEEVLDYVYHMKRHKHIIATFLLDTALALVKIAGSSSPMGLKSLQWSGTLDWENVVRFHSILNVNDANEVTMRFVAEDQQQVRTVLGQCNLQQTDFISYPDSLKAIEPLTTLISSARTVVDKKHLYETFTHHGLNYAPFLENIEALYILNKVQYLAKVNAPDLIQDHYKYNITFAPETLAALLQVSLYIAKEQGMTDWLQLTPTVMSDVSLGASSPLVTYLLFDAEIHEAEVQASIQFLDADGQRVGSIADARFGRLQPAQVEVLGLQAPEVRQLHDASRVEQPVIEELVNQKHVIQQRLESTLRALVSNIVAFDIDEIDVNTHFNAFGFDSISTTKLASEISQELNIQLNPAIMFQYENIRELQNHIMDRHLAHLESIWQGALAPTPQVANEASAVAPVTFKEVSSPSVAVVAPQEQSSASSMPIAIIGMSGRFPQSDNPEELMSHLLAGDDLVAPFPLERYDSLYQQVIGSSSFPKKMGALNEVDAFDAEFFDISPLEAEFMDPQQRLALETVWQAVEDSGYRPSQLPEDTGIFMGVTGMDYANLLATYKVPSDAWTSSGNSHAMLVNRISYILDIHGPSEPIDTACSSSLVAIHRAMESIRSGHCDLAIAGGVNLLLSVETFESAHLAGMLSPDGACKTFGHDANGYVRGEGVGALVLKPLDQARKDGDHILGVLIGNAENHGGRASSLTAPSVKAQAKLVTRAMRGIDPQSISYIESHGTGTKLGDPIELEGLKLAYEQLAANATTSAQQKGFCGVGSLKTNIGHLEAAAGVASVIKVLLAMKHEELPATLHAQKLNAHLDIENSPFYILQKKQAWRRQNDEQGNSMPRRAGVSSFGFGGANAHVVIEDYVAECSSYEHVSGPFVILLSARNEERLQETVRRLVLHMKCMAHPEEHMPEIAYTLQLGREEMAARLALVVTSHRELEAKLNALISGQEPLPGLYRGQVTYGKGGLAVFDADERLESFANEWISRKQYGPILTQWVKGLLFDWNRLYTGKKPRRISLPGYPFAHEHYWLPQSASPTADVTSSSGQKLETLIDHMLNDVLDNTLAIEDAAKNLASFL